MHLGKAKDFTLGTVVKYFASTEDWFGHVDGFTLNASKEILVVVKLPFITFFDAEGPPKYEYIALRPDLLEIM